MRSRCSASCQVDHPAVAQALNNLAFLAHDQGDLTTAVKMSRDSLEMYRRTLGAEHPEVAQGMNNLAMWLIEAGDLTLAEPLVRERWRCAGSCWDRNIRMSRAA